MQRFEGRNLNDVWIFALVSQESDFKRFIQLGELEVIPVDGRILDGYSQLGAGLG